MCIPGLDPISMAGMAMSAAGSVANAVMQNQAVSAQNAQNRQAMERQRAARDAEVERQRGWEQMQADEVTRALSEADPIRQAEATAAAVDDPGNQVMAAADEYNVPALQGQVANADVDQSIGRTIAGQAERTRNLLRAAATLQGQAGAGNDVAQALFGMGSQVSNIGSNRRGSMNAAAMETNIPAAQVRPSSSLIGDLLMVGGGAMGRYGGARAGLPNTYMPGQKIGPRF